MGFLNKIKNKIKGNQKKDEVLEVVKKTSNEKYQKGLSKSRETFSHKIQTLFTKHREVNEDYFNELEEILIMSDVGATLTIDLIKFLKEKTKIKKITNPSEMNELIFSHLFKIYDLEEETKGLNLIKNELNIIIVIGVNGVGKTTSIGKLTHNLKQNFSVSLAAADTFRAGAVEQLKIWANRNEVEITTPIKEGADPASVVYQAIHKAKEDKTEVLIIDTAGRIHNKQNLMKELEKIYSIIEKESGTPAKETLLVLDATTGQNGIVQASAFNEIAKLTGIILTKMDSSSKGGIIISIKEMFNIPVKFIGLGESIEDLEEFDLSKYLYALTDGLEINEQEE